MIWLYTGTPGSGKSFHATKDIYIKTKKKKMNKVIANYNLDLKDKQKKNFIYLDNSEITVNYLIAYALKNNEAGKENQTLLVLDEAGVLFNSRDWNTKAASRMEWIKFFSQHRKFGYNIILIAQDDRMIDRQIRNLVEYEVAHMKVNNYFKFLPTSAFLAVTRWYGQKMKISSEMFLYTKKISKLYNTVEVFDTDYLEKIEA